MENVGLENAAQPVAAEKEETSALEDSTPEAEKEVFVPVKFNKEIKNLGLEDAARLAQKGLKFEAIADDYEALKNIAAKAGHSVSEYIAALKKQNEESRLQELTDKCGGNGEMASYVMQLESGGEESDSFKELNAEFPEIKSIADLPAAVVENAELRGTKLLDEYLRYRLTEEREAKTAALKQKNTENLSLGSLTDRKGGINPETAEFLKGLWR